MNLNAMKIGMSSLVILLILAVASSKSFDDYEQESFPRNRLVYGNSIEDEFPAEAELFKYLLRKELFSKANAIPDRQIRQKKGHYWKPCAFNAVSCFGKK